MSSPRPADWPDLSSAVFYEDPAAAIDLLERAFGFVTRVRVEDGAGRIVHSELTLGAGVVMVSGRSPTMEAGRSPKALGGANTQSLFGYVEDLDALIARAVAAGIEVASAPYAQDYGDRTCLLRDPEGHLWCFAERVSPEAWEKSTAPHRPAGWRPASAAFRPRVAPALTYQDVAGALAFLTEAFGFKELFRLPMADGTIGHAEVGIGDEVIMIGPEWPEAGMASPLALGRVHGQVHVYVEDVDAHCARARAAGAIIAMEPADQFYGDRVYRAVDPEGHRWVFATHVRDVSMEEMIEKVG